MNDYIFIGDAQITKMQFNELYNENLFINVLEVYNSASSIPLHKFWLLVKQCKVIKKTLNIIHVAISSANLFVNLKKSIESIISQNFNKNTSVKNELSLPFFYYSDIICFDANNNEVNFDILQNDTIDLIVELDKIILHSNKIFFKWKIIQTKKTTTFNTRKSLFPDDNVENNSFQRVPQQHFLQNNLVESKQICQTNPVKKQEPTVIAPKAFILTSGDLQNALLKLKKSSNDNPTKDEETIKNDVTIKIPLLKHVTTNESPNVIVNMLRHEHNTKMKEDFKTILKIHKLMMLNSKMPQILKKVLRLITNGRIIASENVNSSKNTCL